MRPLPLFLLLAAATVAASAATPPTPAETTTDAPPCSLAARLAARDDVQAFWSMLQSRGLAADLRRTDLQLTLFAPTDAALAAGGSLPPTAPGGGSVAGLVAAAPAALPVVIGGHFVRGIVPAGQLTRGKSFTTLLTDKAVGQADRPLSLRVETDGAVVSDAGVRAHVLTPDDGRCGTGAPALFVVDTVLLPFKLDK